MVKPLGADAVEMDVRLTKDEVPVVYHYFYLHPVTSLNGPIFDFTYEELLSTRYAKKDRWEEDSHSIPSLEEVLDCIGGRIGLEIEIKGPEPEAVGIIGAVLRQQERQWNSMELTSYEPLLLHNIKTLCPTIATDLLIPRSESWMGLDVVTYTAIHRARLAGARAVHLHPTQLTKEVVQTIREHGIDVHAWDVNDEDAFRLIGDLEIPKFSTDRLQQALDFRKRNLSV